jgi:hypothetical protein
MCNGKDRAHELGQYFAKDDGVGRKWAASVPLNRNSFLNGLAAMRYADDSQIVAVRSLKRWDDRHTLPSFRESKQGVRCAAFEQNIGPDVSEAASCVEQPPDGIAGVQQQQRMSGKAADFHETRLAELEGWGAGSQGLGWRQDPTLEAGITLIKSDAHMNFAAFEHGCLLSAEGFTQLYMHVGKALGISRQEPRQHALDRVRWSGDLEHPPFSAPKDLCVFADGVEIGQYAAAIREELLAHCGQNEATPYAVKQPEAQLLLKMTDLSRKCGLSDAQAHRGFRYGAQLGDGSEGSQTPQIHTAILCLTGM